MSTGFEQRLRAEMEQAAVRPRPGLVQEAYRSYRRKRRMTRAVVAAAAAVAIAGTAVGVTTSRTAIPAQTTAYVVSHVSSALATANRITYTTTIISFIQPKKGEPSGSVTDIWDYGTRIRQLDETASGQPLFDDWMQAGPGKPTYTFVDYQQRSWEHGPVDLSSPAPRQTRCQTAELLVVYLTSGLTPAFSDLPSMIESGLRCGLFHLAGHQRVDGIDAIKLTGSAETGITLWVDPHTYLPVQMTGKVLNVVDQRPGPKAPLKYKQVATISIRFRWLPPTQANLAQLTGTIPPGFHLTHPR